MAISPTPQHEPPPHEAKALAPPPTEDASDGVMLALYPDPDDADTLALPGGTPPDQLHVTVAYLGTVDDIAPEDVMRLATGCLNRAPITGDIGGHARFTGGERGDVLVALYDSPGIEQLRRDVCDVLADAGVALGSDHGYTPHITLGYLAVDDAAPVHRIAPRPLTFSALSAVHGTTTATLPFLGEPEEEDIPGTGSDEYGPTVTGPGAGDAWLDVKGKPFPGAATPFGKKDDDDGNGGGKDKGKGKGPKIAAGSFVALGDRKGKVDLVVTTGTVPGATSPSGEEVEATPISPAARVVIYEPTGAGTFKATGKKFAASLAKLRRVPPLRTRETKSLDEALTWAVLGHGDEGLPPPPVPMAALRTVYGRGVKAWPGADRTTLTAHQWALGRVDAFAAAAAGMGPAGYHADDDLLPGGAP